MRLLRSFEFFVVIFLLLVAAAYWIRYAPMLPETVPTHFGFGGQADSWSSTQAFAWIYWSVMAGLVVLFVGVAFLILKVPEPYLNLPRKELWMTPERAEETRFDIAKQMLGFCAITQIFYLFVFHLGVRAALDGSARLGSEFNWALGGYLGYTALWAGHLLWKYSRAPRSD